MTRKGPRDVAVIVVTSKRVDVQKGRLGLPEFVPKTKWERRRLVVCFSMLEAELD